MNIIKRYSFASTLIILCLLFYKLFSGYANQFSEIEAFYNEGSSINLAKGVNPEKICNVLMLNNYVEHKEDAMFMSQQLASKLNNVDAEVGALLDLNKRAWQIPATTIDSIGSKGFREKLAASQYSLGADDAYNALDVESLASSVTLSNNFGGRIVAKIVTKNTQPSIVDKLLNKKRVACGGVVVRLSEHYLDSLNENMPSRHTLHYLKTDDRGEAVFEGLNPELSYSVLPIQRGYEYGAAKGTTKGSLSESSKGDELSISFTQDEHRIRMFDAVTLSQIKADNTITIRSPKEFQNILMTYIIMFFAAWVGLYLWCLLRKKSVDFGLLSVLMLLTALCLLMMFSINNPLYDRILGIDMAQGIVAGVLIIALLINVDFAKLYQNRLSIDFDIPFSCLKWLFKPFRKKVSYLTQSLSNKRSNWLIKIASLLLIVISLPLLLLDAVKLTTLSEKVESAVDKLPKGSGYMMLALFLTFLLLSPLGVAVGGMRVNLNLGVMFQPSEIAKYLIIFFIASFFCSNASKIVSYSAKGNVGLFGDKLKMLGLIILGLSMLMGLYLALGDMGPALVLSFTFIILYSIIKSQIDLENQEDSEKLKRILTCDLAMLVYGVVSFVLLLVVGNNVGSMGMCCILWFALWFVIGMLKKQVFESAIIFNIIIAVFVFGGSMFEDSSVSALASVADRLNSRNEMCTNTWGTLPINGAVANAGENTQVAEGLWGLASGGFWGQGISGGSPSYIPAFHTDMILESIGEQLGFIGIFIILLLIIILLRKVVLLGYKTSHPFIFYLCTGIAIVTTVQFVIISFGSTGIMPLTGVTVPFFSYGRVSMILNLAAFGIVLSASQSKGGANNNDAGANKNISKYNYSISILSWIFSALILSIMAIFYIYQCVDRNDILIRPVYVNNASGIPIVSYNPRITQLTNKMNAGDIFDRHGVLLATSDKSKLSQHNDLYSKLGVNGDFLKRQKRYYPFQEHLYFMLGDYNTKLFFSSSDASPRGYMAEARHLNTLRGYDNVLRDINGKAVKVDLSSDEYNPGRFYSSGYSISQNGLQLRDYSALIPYLKAGMNSSKVARVNSREGGFLEFDRIKPQDVNLTIDAVLQTKLQQRISRYMSDKFSASQWNKLRVSVVILDAQKGDLLASANYPVPDYQQLRTTPDIYSDNQKDSSWKSYTDMDLGLSYSTPPGSTAKIMTALAGFRSEGMALDTKKYRVDTQEKIFRSEPIGDLDVKLALRYSSNCYFVNLVNDKRLYDELAYVYGHAGIRMYKDAPYVLNYTEPTTEWISTITSQEDRCVDAYERYMKRGVKEKMSNRTGKPVAWSWAWGQNDIYATPAAIARITSSVANDGKMPITRYLLDSKSESIEIVSESYASKMSEYLKFTAKEHDKFRVSTIGGKTGTPERVWRDTRNRDIIVNDGWYVCFIEDANISTLNKGKKQEYKSPITIAVRMERINDGMSGRAVALTKDVVIKTLNELGYIKK